MGSFENFSQENPEVPVDLSDAKKDLEEKFKKKSFFERHFAEFQTRKVPIKGAENPEEMRGETFRFERGQIVKAYGILRKEIEGAEEQGEEAEEEILLLDKIRDRAKVLESNLDRLERQYYENVKMVEIDTEFGKFTVPVAELDLRKTDNVEGEEEGSTSEKDERIPYFLLGSVAVGYHQTAALSMGLALKGERVFVPTWPELSTVGRPDNFAEILGKQQDLSIHKEYAKQTIRKMGLEKINLMGYSMGAAVALDLAQDQDFEEMQDLVVVEPPGLENKGLLGIGKDFGLDEGLLKTAPYSEAMIKLLKQGHKGDVQSMSMLIQDGRILGNQLFNAVDLSKINPKGRYQLWVGTKSSITDSELDKKVFLQADEIRKQNNSEASPIEIRVVEGGTHGFPSINNLGFSRMMLDKKIPEEQITTVDVNDLENSGMAGILMDIE